eukprot:1743660-Rhodomonas_salina.2
MGLTSLRCRWSGVNSVGFKLMSRSSSLTELLPGSAKVKVAWCCRTAEERALSDCGLRPEAPSSGSESLQ